MLSFRGSTCAEICRGCSSGLLLVLNGACILISMCTIGFAVVDARIVRQYGEDQAGGTFASDMMVVGACVMLIVVAGVGCYGAVLANIKILYMYIGLLMILVIIQLLISILVSVKRYGLEYEVTEFLRNSFFSNVTGDELAVHQGMWDRLQSSYDCCGLNGPEDYLAIHLQIPMSCCDRAYRARTSYAQNQLYNIESGTYYASGCEEEILEAIQLGADGLLGVGIICFWFETAGMLLAMWMTTNLKNEVQVYKDVVKY